MLRLNPHSNPVCCKDKSSGLCYLKVREKVKGMTQNRSHLYTNDQQRVIRMWDFDVSVTTQGAEKPASQKSVSRSRGWNAAASFGHDDCLCRCTKTIVHITFGSMFHIILQHTDVQQRSLVFPLTLQKFSICHKYNWAHTHTLDRREQRNKAKYYFLNTVQVRRNLFLVALGG